MGTHLEASPVLTVQFRRGKGPAMTPPADNSEPPASGSDPPLDDRSARAGDASRACGSSVKRFLGRHGFLAGALVVTLAIAVTILVYLKVTAVDREIEALLQGAAREPPSRMQRVLVALGVSETPTPRHGDPIAKDLARIGARVKIGDMRTEIDIVEVMTMNDAGLVAEMRAYWSAEDMRIG